jgi:hypothetical protein
LTALNSTSVKLPLISLSKLLITQANSCPTTHFHPFSPTQFPPTLASWWHLLLNNRTCLLQPPAISAAPQLHSAHFIPTRLENSESLSSLLFPLASSSTMPESLASRAYAL